MEFQLVLQVSATRRAVPSKGVLLHVRVSHARRLLSLVGTVNLHFCVKDRWRITRRRHREDGSEDVKQRNTSMS